MRKCVSQCSARRGRLGGGFDDAHLPPSPRLAQDMSSINDIVGDTKVMKALNTEHRVQGRRIDELQTRMEEELESACRVHEHQGVACARSLLWVWMWWPGALWRRWHPVPQREPSAEQHVAQERSRPRLTAVAACFRRVSPLASCIGLLLKR